MGLTVRTARKSDIDNLVDIEFSSFSSDRISPRSWSDLIDSASATVLICEHAKKAVGCVVLLYNSRTTVARVYSLAVRYEERGQGIGTKLLDCAILKASKHDCAVIRLETRFENHAAQRLFIQTGFQQIGAKPGYYEDGATALRYELTLSTYLAAAE